MPIYDLSYRRLEQRLPPPVGRFAIIARLGILERLSRRWFDLLIGVSLLPFVVFAIALFVSMRYPELTANVPILKFGPSSFRSFLWAQSFFAFLVTIFAGSGVISGDIRTRALPLYLSKPISPFDYIVGKLMVPTFFLALVTALPAELLWLMRVLTGEGVAFFTEHPLLPVRILLASAVTMVVMSVLMLALSSLSRSAWLPGLGLAIIYLFAPPLAGLMRLLFKTDLPILLSLHANLSRVSDGLFGTPPTSGPSWLASLAVLVLVTIACGVVLRIRIRGVDVVSS